MTLTITLLGTGNPIPDANRAGPSTLIQGAGTTLLVDCGRGVVMRLAAAGVMPPALDALLITHLHSDHLTDLNDIITSHWVLTMAPTTLRIYGPPGIREVVDAILASLRFDISYRIAHHQDLTWEPQLDVIELAAVVGYFSDATASRSATLSTTPSASFMCGAEDNPRSSTPRPGPTRRRCAAEACRPTT